MKRAWLTLLHIALNITNVHPIQNSSNLTLPKHFVTYICIKVGLYDPRIFTAIA